MQPTTESELQFAICIAGDPSGDLVAWKVYRVLPDEKAAAAGCLRVIDDSGEDYLYAANRFTIVDLPNPVREKLLSVVETQ